MTSQGHVGWIEFITPGEKATTHIAYAYEDGSVYLPEGPDVVSEWDFRLAAATDRFWPLERSADDLRVEALFIAAMLNGRNEASIKAEALREAADELATYDLTDRQSGYLLAGRHIIARLRARADQIEARER